MSHTGVYGVTSRRHAARNGGTPTRGELCEGMGGRKIGCRARGVCENGTCRRPARQAMKGVTTVPGATRRLVSVVGWSGAPAFALILAVAGCATQADLLQQERKLSGLIEQQSRSLDELKRDIQAMREERAP